MATRPNSATAVTVNKIGPHPITLSPLAAQP